MRIGYSRVSSDQQTVTGALEVAQRELEHAGVDRVFLDIGSGRSDTARPKFRELRELILDGKVESVVCPSQDRLGRNTELVLRFVQLCHMQGVELLDLNGRALETKTADGRLMTTIVAALDAHRSDLYSEKTRRHRRVAKEQGFPVRSKVPFGLTKVRNEAGRVVALAIDPVTGPMARERIDWYLKENLSLIALTKRIAERHPDHTMWIRSLSGWLRSPLLTGRYAWGRDTAGNFSEVNPEQSFPALISDAEHEAVKRRLAAGATDRAVRGRRVRMFTGLIACSCCGGALTYKTFKRSEAMYLRCGRVGCPKNSKNIKVDRVFGVLQYALSEHAGKLLPILQRPKTDPPEVMALQQQIEVLQTVPGAEELIEAKRLEINYLRSSDTETPAWLLIGLMRSPLFWLQDDVPLNNALRLILEKVEVDLGASVEESKVISVRCRTAPSEAPLPPDPNNILMRRTLADAQLLVHHTKAMTEAMKAIG